MSSSVAFFRNLNLGQRRSNSPTREELLAAFDRAGAIGARSFQVNGTVIFDCDTDPQGLADEAVRLLTTICGYDDMAIARPVDWLRDLVPADVPANAEVSFFDGPDPFPETTPWCATYVLEKRLGVPVTSRGVPTIRRLRAKLD